MVTAMRSQVNRQPIIIQCDGYYLINSLVGLALPHTIKFYVIFSRAYTCDAEKRILLVSGVYCVFLRFLVNKEKQ